MVLASFYFKFDYLNSEPFLLITQEFQTIFYCVYRQ
jgi:hypothetical protein